MNVLFAGGGTGGHLYPAIAIADALRGRANVRFAGTADRLEARIVPEAGYDLIAISSAPLKRSFSFAALRTAAANLAGIAQAMRALLAFRPDLVIATGGYVCFPVIVAAKLLRLVGRIPARLALDEVWGAFARADAAFARKYVRTGIPVRAALFRANNRIEAARRLGLDPNRRTILAVGGSQGARSINEAVAALVTRRALPADWQILHLCGERDYEYMKAEEREKYAGNAVVLLPYLPDMADAYALSDAVIARAGASTLGELAALGIPSLLVPYPFAADDHQTANARAFESGGAACVIADKDLSADTLWWKLRDVMDPQRLAAMRAAARSIPRSTPAGCGSRARRQPRADRRWRAVQRGARAARAVAAR